MLEILRRARQIEERGFAEAAFQISGGAALFDRLFLERGDESRPGAASDEVEPDAGDDEIAEPDLQRVLKAASVMRERHNERRRHRKGRRQRALEPD